MSDEAAVEEGAGEQVGDDLQVEVVRELTAPASTGVSMASISSAPTVGQRRYRAPWT